jgi:hypothetical protein
MAVSAATSLFQDAAKILYRKSEQRGEGGFLLISKCAQRWRVVMFPSAEKRAEYLTRWAGNAGCSYCCMGVHYFREIVPATLGWNSSAERAVR